MNENLLKELIYEMLLLERKKRKQTKRRTSIRRQKRTATKRKSRSPRRTLSAKTRNTLKNKAKKANMPLGALTGVYRKGLAAWTTGHRPGVPQHQWAMARVNSFIRGGKTRSIDKGEWKMVQRHRSRKRTTRKK